MRRRVIVFFSVFLLCALTSLAYTFMRPAIYLADARLQVTPAAKLAKGDAALPDNTPAVLVELQVLSSRPLLEKVVERLAITGEAIQGTTDPVASVQEMLKITRVEGTNVIHIQATGAQKQLLPRMINTLIEVYGEQQALAGQSTTQTELKDAREEMRAIESRVSDMKKSVEAFRVRSNIVSAERDENRTLSRLKGLGTSLSAATDREAIAEGKVQALEQATNEGKRAPKSKDNPTVANIEQRLSQAREEWRALERQFTPQYLDMDPGARALRTRIANLEQQLEGERGKSQENALAEAREELASAKAASRRLQQQLAEDKQSVQTFSRQFGEYQAMQEELRGLDQMRMVARQRLLGLEASQVARKPRTQVLELAAVPEAAWRPLYWRDAGISLAGSLLLGLLAVWFVEFFNRAEPVPAGPQMVVIPQPWPAMTQHAMPQLGATAAGAALPLGTQAPLLSAPTARELTDSEVRRLLASAAPEHQLLLVCLLCGMTSAEVVASKAALVDTQAKALTIPGERGQALALEGPLLHLVARAALLSGETPLFERAPGEPMTLEDVRSVVTSSALDANLSDAQEVVPETLRHTYIAFLVRQGLRFSELRRVVGLIPSDTMNALSLIAPGSTRVALDAVDRLLPAVRELAHA
jgi:succinoglycan biosynthesis transport protein ExoP